MNPTRRAALASLSAVPAALAAKAGPTLAVQGYVWMQHYGRLGQKAEDHAPEIFAAFHRAGYRALDLIHTFFPPERTGAYVKALRDLQLRVPVLYHGGRMHTPEDAARSTDSMLSVVRRLKGPLNLDALCINADPKPAKAPKTGEELDYQSGAMNRLALSLKDEGVRLMVHQHDPEMANDAREWRHILKNTDPKLVHACLDTHWVLRGGQNVMTILQETAPRLISVHLRNSKNGIWMEELGDGDIDYRAVAAFLKKLSYSGYLVVELAWDKETAFSRSLEDNLTRSRLYAEQVFGVKA
jgi:sugar phosphate isomerase/epimerase